MTPVRALDTRTPGGSCLADRTPRFLAVAGIGDVPSDAAAVAVNITVTAPSAAGFLTAYPSYTNLPTTSSVNFLAGQTVANAAIVKVGGWGGILLYANVGCPEVIVDITGWYIAGTPNYAGFSATTPQRVYDTRVTAQGPCLSPGVPRKVTLAGLAGIPTAATAVAVNVTVTAPSSAGFVAVYPSGSAVPSTSSVNYIAGQTVPNFVQTKLGVDGAIAILSNAGCPQVIVDVIGSFTSGVNYRGGFKGLPPVRAMDTRETGQGPCLSPASPRTLTLAGVGGILPSAAAVTVNVTVTAPKAAGFVTISPSGTPTPPTSNLNFMAGQTVANSVTTKLGPNGAISILANAGCPQVIVDIVGWYSIPPTPILWEVSPKAGRTAGGTVVTIYGVGVGRATKVMVGNSMVSQFGRLDESTLWLRTPAAAPGMKDVQITTSTGTTTVTSSARFEHRLLSRVDGVVHRDQESTITHPDGAQLVVPAGVIVEPTSNAHIAQLDVYEWDVHIDGAWSGFVTTRLPVEPGTDPADALAAHTRTSGVMPEGVVVSNGFVTAQVNELSYWAVVKCAVNIIGGAGAYAKCLLKNGVAWGWVKKEVAKKFGNAAVDAMTCGDFLSPGGLIDLFGAGNDVCKTGYGGPVTGSTTPISQLPYDGAAQVGSLPSGTVHIPRCVVIGDWRSSPWGAWSNVWVRHPSGWIPAVYFYEGPNLDQWTTEYEVCHTPPRPSSTTPPVTGGPITLSRGAVAPSGYYYAVSLTGFAANADVTVRCHDSVDPAGFHAKVLRTNGSGAASSSTVCFSGDGPDHWVTVGGGQSNHVSWAGGSGGGAGGASPPPMPTGAATIALAQGSGAPSGSWYSVSLSGFAPGSSVTLTCHDSVDLGGFYSQTFTINSAGQASDATLCYSGDGPDHWVTGAGVSSNHVTWSGAPPPPPPPPPGGPAISLAQGGAAPAGSWYSVSLSGFTPGSSVTVTCRDSVDPAGFYTQTFAINGAGQASDATLCYSGDHPDHWVTAPGVESNHVSW